MKYGRATTDLHAKSNMHHQTNIAVQTNVWNTFLTTIKRSFHATQRAQQTQHNERSWHNRRCDNRFYPCVLWPLRHPRLLGTFLRSLRCVAWKLRLSVASIWVAATWRRTCRQQQLAGFQLFIVRRLFLLPRVVHQLRRRVRVWVTVRPSVLQCASQVARKRG